MIGDILNYVIGPYLHVSSAVLLGAIQCQYTQPHGVTDGTNSHMYHIYRLNRRVIHHYRNSILHRDDGPTVEWKDGTKEWWLNGKLHRIGGPAVEYANGNKSWYEFGLLHRTGGPAVEWADGSTLWYKHGKRHRIGGPAIERSNGENDWYENDKFIWTSGNYIT